MPGWGGTLAQRVSLGLAVVNAVFGVIGLIVNPDFGTGSELSSQQFLIDWNGWHAVSALVLGATAFVAAARPLWAVAFLAGNAVANVIESVWAVFDRTPLGVLYFPNVATDLALHLAIAAVSLIAVIAQLARDRATRQQVASA
jgi:hypothetical protein